MHNSIGDKMEKSFWMSEYDVKIANAEFLNNLEVLIIGGGITGIMTAYELSKSNIKVAIATADKIGTHTSAKTTAKVSAIHNLLYQNIFKIHGFTKTKKYFESQKEAINNIIDIINKEKIECDLEKVDNYVFSETSKGIKSLKKEESILKKIGVNIKNTNSIPINKKIKQAFKYEEDYIFHPIKYMNAIIKILIDRGVFIYEGYTAINYKKTSDGYSIIFSNGEIINARHVVVATHYPIFDIPGLYFGKLYQEKSYLVAFETAKEIKSIYINTDMPVRSLRYSGNRSIIMVGNSHIAGENVDYQEKSKNLINSVLEFDKNAKILNVWTNQDVMSIDYLPFIGQYSRFLPNMYVATAFQTWGMTNSHIASKIISDIIQKKDNKYINLYNPLRLSHIKSLNESCKMIKKSINGLILTKFNKREIFSEIKEDEGKIIKYKGNKYAVYNNGKENIILKTNCTHLNCSLQWNSLEKTWDCKCHGSRFDVYGNVKDGPATKPINKAEIDDLL